MRAKKFLIFWLTILFLSIPARSEEAWRKIENNWFSFSVPASFKKTEKAGIDSFGEEYVADGIEVNFDYGVYSNSFADWPKETKFENFKVDGKDARVGTVALAFHEGFPYSTQVHIKLENGVALSMFAACKSERETVLARKIFETIAFKTEKPNKRL